MKIIFLDVDGVLNYEGSASRLASGSYFVEDDKLELLHDLVKATGAEIVLSSSWRSGWSFQFGERDSVRIDAEHSQPYFMLCAKMNDHGLSFLSETPLSNTLDREELIQYWLEEWPGRRIESYVIFDDEKKYFSKTNEHLVCVSNKTGLLPEHIEQAKRILNESKPKILIVDDVELNREVIKVALGSEYELFDAVDGNDALEQLNQHSDIDLVITDIQMAGMDGIKLIEQMRKNHKFAHIPILANTQYGDPGQEETILEAGADDFVYKPSSPKIIQIRVKNVLRSR